MILRGETMTAKDTASHSAMDVSPLLDRLRAHPAYQVLLRRLRAGGLVQGPLRLPRAARPTVAAALAQDLLRPVVLLLPRRDRMLTLMEELPAWSPDLRLIPFPEPNPLFYEKAPWGPRTLRARAAALAVLLAPRMPGRPHVGATRPTLVLATARSVMTHTLSASQFLRGSRWIAPGMNLRMDRLLKLLVDGGYEPTSVVTEQGQFGRRGGILDLWSPAHPRPVRVEFFGDEIDSLRTFDPSSQRSTGAIEGVLITPAREGLPRLYRDEWDARLPDDETDDPHTRRTAHYEFFLPWMNPSPTGLLDLLPPEAVLLIDDGAAYQDTVIDLEEQALALREEQVRDGQIPSDFPLPYLTWNDVQEMLLERRALDLGLVSGLTEDEQANSLGEAFSPGPRFGGQMRPLLNHLSDLRRSHEAVVLVSRQAPRLAELWIQGEAANAPVLQALPRELQPGDLHFVHGALSEGWTFSLPSGERFHLLTDAEVFGWVRPRPRVRPIARPAAPESAFADLRPGDWVVHEDYGIGRFQGLVERTLEGSTREYLLIQYAEGDQLFVPVHQADRISRYVGVGDAPPSASRLGGHEWARAKGRARQAAEEIARDLLELYARRMAAQGHAFSPDSEWQRELEASFPYAETEDQARALAAVKEDMERPRPMDRLICGDVGYGKTEVALRAAFKAVMDGKQVALLVPTTVLAQQHFRTFRQRLAPFPVAVEMLSRFRTPAETNRILQQLALGEIDIVIGTHRLLQRDVHFKDLGLLIIDEEQRFGVTHKEHFKRLRTEIDVLTLTATPIPRTLYMALTGVRDISNINTPPQERLPVITHVGTYDPRLVRQAILRELDRGGQVFFVHNRVRTIEGVARRLERLVPDARIAIAHGQMPERELEQVMERFTAGEIDVLVSTSIIESGLDIPNANTLIVDRADTFGLAQLYQLRGRVGRGATRAYAYFFRHPRFRATEEALQRLEVIAEHTQLGAGFAIAMRDLEIRGAGDILGTRQHGHIAAVGFHLYTRLLAEAVRRLRRAMGETEPHPGEVPLSGRQALPVTVELPLPGAIPPQYVSDRDLRLQLYRRMAGLRSLQEVEALREEFKDRFGPLPEEVENLLFSLRAKVLAAQAGISAISSENGQILLQMPRERAEQAAIRLGREVRASKRGLWLLRDAPGGWPDRLLRVLVKLAEIEALNPH